MALVNCLISTNKQVEVRVQVRNAFINVGLIKVIDVCIAFACFLVSQGLPTTFYRVVLISHVIETGFCY